MTPTRIIPQRLQTPKSRKWIQCEPHQAQRFALVRGIRILQTYPTMEAAKRNLPSNSYAPVKPLNLGDRYPEGWRGTYAASLSQDQYNELKNRRLK